MVTIRDVARHANVSVATVSRVTNKSGFVSDDLSQRVRHSIATLGFEPDFLARTWRTRVTRMVAAVLSDNTSPHHSIALREAGLVALAHDYNLILCTTYFDTETERRYLRMLRLRRVDGVLLNNIGPCDDEVRALTSAGVPVVLLNRPLADHGLLVDAVVVDSYRGAFDVVTHLIRQGHRRIAMLCGGMHNFHRSERLRGYSDALHSHGLAYDESLVRWNDAAQSENPALVTDLLAAQPRPTALFASGYSAGLLTMRVLRNEGICVPGDMAFAMYDDVAWGAFMDPPLTLVRNPAEAMGRVAMELLFARMADHSRPPQEVRLQPELVIRRSCGWTGQVGVAATPWIGAAALLSAGC